MAKSGANYASLYIQETRFASAFFLLKCKGANNYRITKLMDQQSSHRRIGLLFFFFLSAKEFHNNNKYLLTSTFIYITINITLFSGFIIKRFYTVPMANPVIMLLHIYKKHDMLDAFFYFKCKGANNYRITKLMHRQSSHRRIHLFLFIFFLCFWSAEWPLYKLKQKNKHIYRKRERERLKDKSSSSWTFCYI